MLVEPESPKFLSIGNISVPRALITVDTQGAVTFAENLTIDEAKHVIIELVKSLGVNQPPDCGALEPRAATFEERHAANEATLAELARVMGMDK